MSVILFYIYLGVNSEQDPLADATYIRANFSYIPRQTQVSVLLKILITKLWRLQIYYTVT